MSNKKLIYILTIVTIIGIGLNFVYFLLDNIIPVIFNQELSLVSHPTIKITQIQPTCLRIEPQVARRSENLQFSVQNQCGGLISILSEKPQFLQSSSAVGHLINSEEEKYFKGGKLSLETSLLSRTDLLNNTFNPWYFNHLLWRNWSILGKIGTNNMVISGITKADGIGIFLFINRILLIIGIACLIVLVLIRLLSKETKRGK